jgi:hypothetical protein
MTEFLIQKSPIKYNVNDSDSNSVKEKDELFKVDLVKETLRRLRPRSKLKKNLSFILSKFYSCPISIIFISYIFGFLTFGLPLLFVYNDLITNIIIPILIICVFSLVFSIILIIVHCVDGKKNKAYLIAKWERKNILKNIGVIFTLIILIVSVSLTLDFYSRAISIRENQVIVAYDVSDLSKELNCDYFFRYIFNMICFKPSQLKESNENNIVKYYFYEDNILVLSELRKKLMVLLIPLLVISFNKVIKCFLIQVKYTIEQFTFFFGAFVFFLFNIIINSYEEDKLTEYFDLFSIIQNVLIGLIYIGYVSWIFHNSFKFMQNPKDKNFAIREYKCINILIILLFDFISFLGATGTFLSILYFYLSETFAEGSFKKLNISFIILKIGFLLIAIGNSYYFGHYLLSMIFRPISIQYAPYELKNKCYIKANRKLLNILNTRKKGLKLKDV